MQVIEVGAHKITITERTIRSNIKTGDPNDMEFDAAVDGIESLLLAMACEGVDLSSQAVQRAVETALTAASEYL